VQQFPVSGDLGDERVEAEKAGRSAEIRRRADPRGDAPVLGQGRAHANDILVVMATVALRQASPFQHLRIRRARGSSVPKARHPHAAVGCARKLAPRAGAGPRSGARLTP
jgi:hypothetical protein